MGEPFDRLMGETIVKQYVKQSEYLHHESKKFISNEALCLRAVVDNDDIRC